MNIYNLENLNNDTFLSRLMSEVDEIEQFNDVNAAFKVLNLLHKAVKEYKEQIDSDRQRIYQQLVVRIKFVLLSSISEGEIEDLFKNHLAVGIKMNYVDLLEKIKNRISLIPVLDRDNFKKILIKAMMDNKGVITSEIIDLRDKQVAPTISAWISNYNQMLGAGAKNNLEQSKYFISNKNFLALNTEERLWIKELVSLYEYFKRSSLKIEGNEDNTLVKDIDEKIYIFKDGRFFDIESGKEKARTVGIPKTEQENNFTELKQMLNWYAEGSLERKAIEEEIAKLKS